MPWYTGVEQSGMLHRLLYLPQACILPHPCAPYCPNSVPIMLPHPWGYVRSLQVLVRWACDKISTAAGVLGDEALMEALQVCCTWISQLSFFLLNKSLFTEHHQMTRTSITIRVCDGNVLCMEGNQGASRHRALLEALLGMSAPPLTWNFSSGGFNKGWSSTAVADLKNQMRTSAHCPRARCLSVPAGQASWAGGCQVRTRGSPRCQCGAAGACSCSLGA